MLTPRQANRRNRRKKFRRRLITILVTLLLLIITSPALVGWIISVKLRSEISARLDASLETGLVLYFPPYKLHINNARLFAHGNSPTLILEIAHLNIALAKLPGPGPLLIRELDINSPVLNLIQTPTGLTAAQAIPSMQSSSTQKLSDLFELRHVAITDGRLEYDNQPAPPVIWQHLGADLRTAPTSPSNYHYQFIAHDAPLVSITSTGQIDIDSLMLNVASFVLDLQTDPAHRGEQLPSQVQELFHRFAIVGHVTLAANGQIPLTDPAHAVFASELRLVDGSAHIPGWSAPITPVQFSLDCYKDQPDANSPPTDVRFQLNQFLIQCEKQKIRIDAGQARFTPADRSWAVGNVAGLVDVGDGPGPARDLDLAGYLPVTADGFGQMSATNNFTIHISVNNGTMKVAPQKIPFQQINTLLTLTNTRVGTSNLTAQVYDAAMIFGGLIDWSPAKGIKYYGEGSLTDMNMKKFADTFVADPADRQLVSGAGDLRAKFSGNTTTSSPSKTFAAIGDVDIRHGHFFVIPVLKNVLRKTKHADAATVGEAAATFYISNRNIDFPYIAASSPLIGVQGKGRITFDDDIDMTLAITPLADWRKTVQDTGIPIFSDLLGYLAGGAQVATDEILREGVDQFRITGQADNPQVQQVPVPILSDTVRSLFHFMSLAKAEDAISKELRRRQRTDSTTQQSQ